jgi:hypothetical protein
LIFLLKKISERHKQRTIHIHSFKNNNKMNFIRKNSRPWLTICLAVALFSCNNDTEQKEEPKKTGDSVETKTTVPVPAAFVPFDVAEISHTVKDYSKWRPFFDADSVNRKASGMENIVVGRGMDNANNILIALKVADVAKAKAFSTDPKLKEVMGKAGVVSKPDVELFHVLRFNADSKEKQWVLVTHKVKDFDAWLKVFDAEGTATRATYGLTDVVLARGIDDPSIVHLVFDITDLAKAKARISDPALKKLMTDAGVTGAPVIKFYTTAD